jgi:thymidylate kinase
MAYQGSQTDAAWVRDMNLNCPEIRRPDLCVFLDLSPEESLRRITRDRTTTEIYEKKEILEAVRARFFSVFQELDDRVAVIDTTGLSIDDVAEKVAAAVEVVK